ncbi:MAG: RNA methyltransferase PUA domain-containing protein, partial [Armatimonadota bacterium]
MARGAGGQNLKSSCPRGTSRTSPLTEARTLTRVFLPPEAFSDGMATLEGQAFRHVARVLRMGEGDHLLLLDGTGRGWVARLERVTRSDAAAILLQDVAEEGPPLREVHLAVPLLKG